MSGVLLSRELAMQVRQLVREEMANNQARPAGGKKRRYPRTAGGSVARLVELDMTKPAYETVSGSTITTYMPSGTGTVYSRDESTGELTLGSDTVNIINAAPRIYDPDTSRGRAVLAVPVQGGGYVPIPMATDPFVPSVSCSWSSSAGGSSDITGSTSGTTVTMDDGNYTLWPTVADSEEHYPPWARPQNDRLYLMRPGHYLCLCRFSFERITTGETFTQQYNTSTVSSHFHTVDIPTPGNVWGTTGLSTSNNGVKPLNGYMQTDYGLNWYEEPSFFWFCVVYSDGDEALEDRYIVPVVKLKDLCPTTHFVIRPYYHLTVLPLSCWNESGDAGTDAEWKHDPWADGTYKWWGTGTEPS